MAVRIQFRRGTAAEWTSANPTLGAGEAGYETDTAKFKLGTGSTAWNSLDYAGINQSDIEDAVAAVIDGAPGALDTLNELSAALNDDASFANTIIELVGGHTTSTTNVHGIANTALLVTTTQLANEVSSLVTQNTFSTLETTVSDLSEDLETGLGLKANLEAPTFTGTVVLPTTTSIGDVSGTEISFLNNVSSAIQTQLNDKATISELNDKASVTQLNLKADSSSPTFTGNVVLPDSTTIGTITALELSYLNNLSGEIQGQLDDRALIVSPEFTGTVTLPADTSIGNVIAAEIGHLDGVTSGIQVQLDGKLATSVASTTYAALAGATFTGNVVLTANTSIGTVSSEEIGYLNDVTSSIQTQLNAKAPTADPTFTGTVSGVTKGHVGLGNVDNTSDVDKPISNAVQTALDAKLNLSGGTMTGRVTLSADPTQALHAVTKQYVDGIEAGLKAKPAVLAATSTNIPSTYNNGTAGVGATLTASSNGSINTSAPSGVSTWVVGSGILVKNQTNKAENGRYVVTNLGSVSTPYVLTRCGLCDEASEIPGAYVFVQDGVHEGTGWVQIVANPTTFVVGTDDIDVFQFSGPGTITAGTNIAVVGGQVSVVSNPTFANVITASSGVTFSDGTQTKQGVPSITVITPRTASYTLANLNERDTIIEISNTSATTLTIPADNTLDYPIGTTLDIIQTNTGQVTLAGAGGVTVNATPGLKLRARWSSATLLKRGANSWLVYGDLTA